MAALAGYNAQIYFAGTGVTISTGSPSQLVDSGDHKTFTSPSAKRYLDDTVPVTVQANVDGAGFVTQSPSLYTIQYCGGIVTFANPISFTTSLVVRLSAGSYLPSTFLGNAKSVDITNAVDIQDATCFQNPASPWKTKQATLIGSDIKLGRWWLDTTFGPLITNSTRMVISAYSGANANQRLEGFARLKMSSLKAAVNALVTQDLEFMVDGQLFWVAS